jgi:hypothetical protein
LEKLHTEDYSLPKVSQDLRTVWLEQGQLSIPFEIRDLEHTPARTRVMSSTLMPANGKVGESVAAVAMRRGLTLLEPLGKAVLRDRATRVRKGPSVAMNPRTEGINAKMAAMETKESG